MMSLSRPSRFSSVTLIASYLYDVVLLCLEAFEMVHDTPARERARNLMAEARAQEVEASILSKIEGMEHEAQTREAQAASLKEESRSLVAMARLEDLTVREEPLVKQTKRGKRIYYRWVASWREGDKVRTVYLGSCRKLSRESALEKAKKMKAEALGLS